MFVHEYEKVHRSVNNQTIEHVSLFWYGGFRRRIDCCKTLHIPVLSDLRRAITQLENAEAEAQPRRLAPIFQEVREKLFDVISLHNRRETLECIHQLEELFFYVSNQRGEAQAAYGHVIDDGRKRRSREATWDAWKTCWDILNAVSTLEIPEQELIELRLQPIRQGQGTLYDAFLLYIHHGLDYGFECHPDVHAIFNILKDKSDAVSHASFAQTAYLDIRMFVRNVWDRDLSSDPAMLRIKKALDRFLPLVERADEDLHLNIATQPADYQTTLVEGSKETLKHLWYSPLRLIGQLPEMTPCNAIQLAYN